MKKITLINFLEYLLAFCIVIECESMFTCSIDYATSIKILTLSLLLFSVGFLTIINIRWIKVEKSKWELFLIFIMFSVIFVIINFNNVTKSVLFLLVLFIFGLYRTSIDSINHNSLELMKKIINVVFVLAIISIVFWILGSVLKVLETNVEIIVTRNKIIQNIKGYYHLYYESQMENTFGFNFYRNCGIFYEAPKYSLLLSIALMMEVFLVKRKVTFKAIMLIVTIISTFSLTGIVLVVFVVLSNFMISKSNLKIFSYIKWVSIFSLILITLIIIGNLLNVKSTTNSYSDRLDDYIAGYKAWIVNPIFGNGYLNMDIIRENMSEFRARNIGFSNSIFRVLAQGGILLFSMYAFPVILWIKRAVYSKDFGRIFFAIGFILLFVTTSFPYNYLMLYLLTVFI